LCGSINPVFSYTGYNLTDGTLLDSNDFALVDQTQGNILVSIQGKVGLYPIRIVGILDRILKCDANFTISGTVNIPPAFTTVISPIKVPLNSVLNYSLPLANPSKPNLTLYFEPYL
jgi:hypothetical protein